MGAFALHKSMPSFRVRRHRLIIYLRKSTVRRQPEATTVQLERQVPSITLLDRRPLRRGLWAAVLLITLIHMSAAPFTALHMDMAKDLFVAQRISTGEHYPWLGPLFGAAFHLGPAWYYGLATLLSLTGSLTWTVLIIAALNSLKFPLAFALATRWGRPDVGLTWVALLALPGWTSFFMVFGHHPGLVEPLAIIAIGLAVAYVRSGRRTTLAATGLVLSLALHAHPSAVILIWPLAAAVLWRWHQYHTDLLALPWAALAFLLPSAPYIVMEWLSDWPHLGGVAGYLGGQVGSGLRVATELPALAIGLSSGPGYWLTTAGDIGAVASHSLALAFCCLAMLLAIRSLPPIAMPASALVAFVLTVLSAGTLLLLRDIVPYYMLGALWVMTTAMLSGIVAVTSEHGPVAPEPTFRTSVPSIAADQTGRAARADSRTSRWTPTLPIGICLAFVGVAATALPIVRHQCAGDWPLAMAPMWNVAGERTQEEPAPFFMVPAHAIDALGRWLCDTEQGRAIHGPLARAVFLDYAMPARQFLGCRLPEAGGNSLMREHWLGLPQHMAHRLDAPSETTIGSAHLYPVKRIPLSSTVWLPLKEPDYPPLSVTATPTQSRRSRLRLDAGERLLIADVLTPAYPWPIVKVMRSGRQLEHVTSELGAYVYTCEGLCGELEVFIQGTALHRMEAVVF